MAGDLLNLSTPVQGFLLTCAHTHRHLLPLPPSTPKRVWNSALGSDLEQILALSSLGCHRPELPALLCQRFAGWERPPFPACQLGQGPPALPAVAPVRVPETGGPPALILSTVREGKWHWMGKPAKRRGKGPVVPQLCRQGHLLPPEQAGFGEAGELPPALFWQPLPVRGFLGCCPLRGPASALPGFF